MTVQAYMLELEIGQWSGFSRKMEIAESFLGPLLTVRSSCLPFQRFDLTPIDASTIRQNVSSGL